MPFKTCAFLKLGGDIDDDYCDTGLVKKVPASLSIVHDCSKCNNDIVAELQSAFSCIREYRVTFNITSRMLNALHALSLFRRMLDEVEIYIYADFFSIFGLSFPSPFLLENGLMNFKTS